MTRVDAFAAWRKAAGPWAQWVKGSLLADADDEAPKAEAAPSYSLALPLSAETGWVLDLPGANAVMAAVGLNAASQCPVPLYNSTSGPLEVVAMRGLVDALMAVGQLLVPLSEGPPVFLLDANRGKLDRKATEGSYDNRWYVFESDFPSAVKLREHGIRRLVVVTQSLANDLRDALAHHTALELAVVDPTSLVAVPFPTPRVGILRTVSSFGRKLDMNYDGSFGHTVVVSQG